MARVLILTTKFDMSAVLVSEVLSAKGHGVSFFAMERFPFADLHTISVGEHAWAMRSSAHQFLSSEVPFDTVWHRRLVTAKFDQLNGEPADLEVIKRIHGAYSAYFYDWLSKFCPATRNSTWISPPLETWHGEDKILQLEIARQCGFSLPRCIVSNDIDAVREFQARIAPARLLCKALRAGAMWQKRTGAYAYYSAVVPDVDSLPEESVAIVPAIYQEYVPKAFEVRSLFLGDQHFSAYIDSQAYSSTAIDWRARPRKELFSPHEIPETLANKCRQMLSELGLRTGSFDFICKPDGEYVFLELNPAGQFLFIEQFCPELKILDAFCHFLANHNLNDWNPSRGAVSMADVHEWQKVRENREARVREMQEIVNRGGEAPGYV